MKKQSYRWSIATLLLITKGPPSSLLEMTPARGDLWMLLAAMIFAAYSILIKLKPVELRLIPFLMSLFLLGTLFLLPCIDCERNSNYHFLKRVLMVE